MSKEGEALNLIVQANYNYKKALELVACHICKEHIKLVLDGSIEVEEHARFAHMLNNPIELKALRRLAISLDELKIFSLLIKLYKIRAVRFLLSFIR